MSNSSPKSDLFAIITDTKTSKYVQNSRCPSPNIVHHISPPHKALSPLVQVRLACNFGYKLTPKAASCDTRGKWG